MLHTLLPAANASADRISRQRDHMQIFSWQLGPQGPYAHFPKPTMPGDHLTKKFFYGIILKKTFFKIAGQFDKYKKMYYNIIGGR